MSGITAEVIQTTLKKFRVSHNLAADKGYDDLLVNSLFALVNPDENNPRKDEIQGIIDAYHAKALAHKPGMQSKKNLNGELDEYQNARFLSRIFRRLLLKKGQFQSSQSQAIAHALDEYKPRFVSDPSLLKIEEAPAPVSVSDSSLPAIDPSAVTYLSEEEGDGADGLARLLPPTQPDANASAVAAKAEARKPLTEIELALAEELFYDDPKKDGYYIGFRNKTGETPTPYQAYSAASAINEAINQERVVSPAPVPPPVNPFSVIMNVNTGIDNALSTSGDRILKFFIALATQAGTVLKNGAEIHNAFSWLGLGVSFVYTTTFALNYLYRRFALKEEVVFGFRDAVRMVLSLGFLTFSIAATFAAGPGWLFMFAFPVIAAISVFFSLGEHVYDYHFKNKEELGQLPEKKAKLKSDITLSKKHLMRCEAELAAERAKETPDNAKVKSLLAEVTDAHTKYKGECAQMVKLLEQERSLKETQIRLRDPLTIFLTVSRTVVAVLNIIAVGIFFVNPVIGLGLIALAGALMLINYGIGVYNKERLDRKIEGRNGGKPAVGELSESLLPTVKPSKTYTLVATALQTTPGFIPVTEEALQNKGSISDSAQNLRPSASVPVSMDMLFDTPNVASFKN